MKLTKFNFNTLFGTSKKLEAVVVAEWVDERKNHCLLLTGPSKKSIAVKVTDAEFGVCKKLGTILEFTDKCVLLAVRKPVAKKKKVVNAGRDFVATTSDGVKDIAQERQATTKSKATKTKKAEPVQTTHRGCAFHTRQHL